VSINRRHPKIHECAEEFWRVWKEVGEPHKHGFYESTWMAIDAALAAIEDDPAHPDR